MSQISADTNATASEKTSDFNEKKNSSKYGFEEVTMFDIALSSENAPSESTSFHPASNPEVPTSIFDKIRVFMTVFLNKKKFESHILVVDEPIAAKKLIPTVFNEVQNGEITQNSIIESFLVFNKQVNKYIIVNDKYLIKPFDKFEIYLVKKTCNKLFVSIGGTEKELSAIDTSGVQSIEELVMLMSRKLDLKKKESIVVQKYDDDFASFVPVEADEKFDSTKSYKFRLTKIVECDIFVNPDSFANFKHNIVESVAENKYVDEKDKKETDVESKCESKTIEKNDKEQPCESNNDKIELAITSELENLLPLTYTGLNVDMINKRYWKDEKILTKIVEVILQKCIEDRNCVRSCADLCRIIHKAEQSFEQDNFKRIFHGAILRKCQYIFNKTVYEQNDECIAKLQEKLVEEQNKEETAENKLINSNKDIQDAKEKEKQRMLGTVRFLGHLFRVGMLNNKIFENCIVILIRETEEKGNEVMLEYVITLMKCVGTLKDQTTDFIPKLSGYVSYLEKFKSNMFYRVKILLAQLQNLRDRTWVIPEEDFWEY